MNKRHSEINETENNNFHILDKKRSGIKMCFKINHLDFEVKIESFALLDNLVYTTST